MGIKLVEEVMDYAPDTLTTGEWKGLVVLARDANEKTRETFHGVNSPEILRRVRLSVPAWSNLRSALIRKGVLEVVQAGVKGRTAVYRIPPLAPQILHPVDEESTGTHTDLHPTDEASDPTLHSTDEESAGFFTQQMTPTPFSSPQLLLSPPQPELALVDTSAAPRERSGSINDAPTPAVVILDAYAAALGRPVTNGTRAKLASHTESLIAAGYPASWLADRAREMAPKGWTDLEQHAARSTVPLSGAAAATSGLPPWCGQCGDGNAEAVLKLNGRFRTHDGKFSGTPCPHCHPDTADNARRPPPTGSHQPYQNPEDQSDYLGAIA